MARAGRKPNEGKPVRHRVKPVHEWYEVEGAPFLGGPELPRDVVWPAWTLRWWEAVSTMPHCALWEQTDWEYALNTALVAKRFHDGEGWAATELARREKILGTTVDSRRDLRIRYVAPSQEERAGITAIEEYRKALEG